jgi:hypothetical protein
METKGWIMLRVLLNRFHQGSIETLLQPLPEEDVRSILNTDITTKEVHPVLAEPGEVLSKIHYSWLCNPINSFPETLRPYLLGALDAEQQKKMIALLGLNLTPPTLSAFSRRYFLHLLHEQSDVKNIIPVPYLPQHPLSSLASFSKQKLIDLIDLLGTYDIASEIRQMISKKKINMIYKALPLHSQKFLKIAFHQQDKLTPYPLNIDMWSGDQKKLLYRLQKAGMRRLSFACTGIHPDILWHIIHTLDQGRGNMIKRDIPKEPKKGVAPAVILQIANIINFLDKAEPHTSE